ncbi:Splicing factor U2af large subunit B [Picochlorum sp. SENEW3]|nr:Splicing factor U2af large subunit B [Picochlorum sp. SENEW3]WPT17179.1 Splicing factor U2af large subunit B [Picochlorum sp. SENEW3]
MAERDEAAQGRDSSRIDSVDRHDTKYVDRGYYRRRRDSPIYDDDDGEDSKSREGRHRSCSRDRHAGRYSSRRRSSRSPSREDRYRSSRRHRRSRSREKRYRRSSRDRYRRRSRDRYYYSSGSEDERRRPYSREHRRRVNDEAKMSVVEDPFAALRSAAAGAVDPAEMARKMQEQQLRARQLVLQQQAVSAVKAASRTQREVYIGGIVPGVVTEPMLRELFRATLTAAFPDKCQNGTVDPVISITLAPEQKFCFMELLSADMASACLELSGQISLMGAHLTIGRPTGYVDPEKAQNAAETAANALATFQADSQAERIAAGENIDKEPSSFICIEGVTTDDILQDDAVYAEILEELKTELEKHGTVLRVVIPRVGDANHPSTYVGKALVQFLDADGAAQAASVIDGRHFDGRVLRVSAMLARPFLDAIASARPKTDGGDDDASQKEA